MTNVIQIDFRRSSGGPLEEVEERFAAVDLMFRGLERSLVQHEYDLYWERRRRRNLEKKLLHERASNFPFTDEDVLHALCAAHDATPVSATDVAARLYPYNPPHSARVRAGLALSRLVKRGLVEATTPPARRITTRWSPKEWNRG